MSKAPGLPYNGACSACAFTSTLLSTNTAGQSKNRRVIVRTERAITILTNSKIAKRLAICFSQTLKPKTKIATNDRSRSTTWTKKLRIIVSERNKRAIHMAACLQQNPMHPNPPAQLQTRHAAATGEGRIRSDEGCNTTHSTAGNRRAAGDRAAWNDHAGDDDANSNVCDHNAGASYSAGDDDETSRTSPPLNSASN